MRYLGILLISFFIISSCDYEKQNVLLTGTMWTSPPTNPCESKIRFLTDSTYYKYNCEMQDTVYGAYSVIDDNIELIQQRSVLNTDFGFKKAKFLLNLENNNKLVFAKRFEWKNDKWIESNFKFDGSVYYMKQGN